MQERHLDMAERHVAEGLARIDRQTQLIAVLDAAGYPTDLAEQILAAMRETLNQMQAHRDYLQARPH